MRLLFRLFTSLQYFQYSNISLNLQERKDFNTRALVQIGQFQKTKSYLYTRGVCQKPMEVSIPNFMPFGCMFKLIPEAKG